MAHCHPLNRTEKSYGKELLEKSYADSSTHFSSVPMYLVTLTVPSTMSNFATGHAAPNHDLQKMLHCQIQALRLEFFSRKPTHIMCGSSCKHDLLLLEALLAAILLAAISLAAIPPLMQEFKRFQFAVSQRYAAMCCQI